jgi:DNA repair protein RadD
MSYVLRDYQLRVIDDMRALIASGQRRIVCVAPTGAGKTLIASSMIKSAAAKGTRVVFLAHRKELIDQSVSKLNAFGVECGVIRANDSRRDDFLAVQVCSTPTLARRMDRLPPAGLVVYDEVHHAVSATSRAILQAWPDAVVIGLTATPWRQDRIGLSDIFGAHVVASTPAELMDQGSLVRYQAFAYDAPDLHKVRVTAGDWNQSDLAIACNTEILVGSVVKEWLAHARGRRTILFPVNVEHSQSLVGEFRTFGIAAEHVDASTPRKERERILRGLDTGDVTLVSSVGVLTEGFDSPKAEVCILARPTKSVSLFLQMIGRVLRPAPGKAEALVHCHSGNLLRHGLVEDPRDYSLTATPKAVVGRLTCPFCCKFPITIRPDGTCPACGQLVAPPKKDEALPGEGAKRAEKMNVEGRRIDIGEIRAKRAAAGLGRELSDKEIVKIATATRRQMVGEYLRLVRVSNTRGFGPSWVAREFRGVFGEYPATQAFTDAELDNIPPADKPFVSIPPRRVQAA